MKKWFENFIKKIAKENQKSFGNKKLDCCGLNNSKSINKSSNKKTK